MESAIVIDPNVIIVAVVAAAAGIISTVATVVEKIITWRKAKKGETLKQKLVPIMEEVLEPLTHKVDDMQVDLTRMRLLNLIRHDPHDAENILKIANQYFEYMHGNSEASKLFSKWLVQENIKCPEWFKYYTPSRRKSNGKKQNSGQE